MLLHSLYGEITIYSYFGSNGTMGSIWKGNLVAYFAFCPVISRRVGRRLLSEYVTSGMNIETQTHTKRNRIKQHNIKFVFSQRNLLFTQHTDFWRGGVVGRSVGYYAVSSPRYEGSVECKTVLMFLLSSTA
jgi:hypothetical protein